MGYIQNERHFKHYLQKVARDGGIDADQMYPAQFYIDNIYQNKCQDEYAWAVRQNAEALTRQGVRDFLAGRNSAFEWPYRWDTSRITDEFEMLLEDLLKRSGCYIFETEDGQALYVGRSISDLGSRARQSFVAQFKDYNEQVFLKCALCNPSDAILLEVYLIATLKPALNRDCKHDSPLTIAVKNLPVFIGRVQCFVEDGGS